MPVQSEKQKRYLFAQHPGVAKRFAQHAQDTATPPATQKRASQRNVSEALLGRMMRQR